MPYNALACAVAADVYDILDNLNLDAPHAGPTAGCEFTVPANCDVTDADQALLDDLPDAVTCVPLHAVAALGTQETAQNAGGPAASHGGKLAAIRGAANRPRGRGSVGFAPDQSEDTPVSVLSSRLASLTSSPDEKISPLRQYVAANQNAHSWRHLSEHDKFRRAMVDVQLLGGWAWTLNLSAKTRLRLERLAAESKNFRHLFTSEVRRQLRKQLGHVPLFALAFEYSNDGRLHLHGVLLPQERTTPYWHRVRVALCSAGGKISGQQGSTQGHHADLFDGGGWWGYCSKSLRRTRRLLGTKKVTFVSRELQQLTKEAYEAFRQALISGNDHNGDFQPVAEKTDRPSASGSQLLGHTFRLWSATVACPATAPQGLRWPSSVRGHVTSALLGTSAVFDRSIVSMRSAVDPAHKCEDFGRMSRLTVPGGMQDGLFRGRDPPGRGAPSRSPTSPFRE